MNINDAKKIIEHMHNNFSRKYKTQEDEAKTSEKHLRSSQLFEILTKYPDAGPQRCMGCFKDMFGINMSVHEVISLLKYNHVANPEEREPLFRWMNDMADLYMTAFRGDVKAFSTFVEKKNEKKDVFVAKTKGYARIYRMLAIALLSKYPELDALDGLSHIRYLGDIFAKYCLFDMETAVSEVYDFPISVSKKDKKSASSEAQEMKKLTYEELIKKLERIEIECERTKSMLQEQQREFNEQLDECKVQELTDFFSRLNSDKYGRILDELFILRKGMEVLRMQNYELPEAINGLMITVTKLLQFVKDSHIDPMMKVGSVKNVKASDIEFFQYEGSPFLDNNETKQVRVISPGWIYRDKQIQISIPKLKEE